MANPVIGDEEDTSAESPAVENKEEVDATSESSTEETRETGADQDKEPDEFSSYKQKTSERFQILTQHNQELKEKAMTLEEKLNKLEQMKSDEPLKVPEAFKRLFGDDPEVYQLWKSEQDDREKTLRAEIIKEINAQKEEESKAEQKEVEEWQEYFGGEIQSLKDDGYSFDADKLQKFVIDNDITDSRGVYDLKRGLLRMMNQNKANPARKAIADMTGGGKSTEQEVKNYATDEDFKGPNRPW